MAEKISCCLQAVGSREMMTYESIKGTKYCHTL